MLKKLIVFILGLTLIFGASQVAHAKTTNARTPVAPKATATPLPTPVDSFSLFWPVSSGKTIQSKVYFLKLLKEKVRGFLIFGSSEKASYQMFIATKRMLEAEFLIKNNLPELANKTLDAAIDNLNKSNSALNNAKKEGNVNQDMKNDINTKNSNLKEFTKSLMNEYPDYKEKLQDILDILNSITV